MRDAVAPDPQLHRRLGRRELELLVLDRNRRCSGESRLPFLTVRSRTLNLETLARILTQEITPGSNVCSIYWR
ncbi:hypothetical protein DMB37_18575 [Nocardia sp. CS682]|nr:hypothetical protein DMB37_18575 [Nocardia sp. CS682]